MKDVMGMASVKQNLQSLVQLPPPLPAPTKSASKISGGGAAAAAPSAGADFRGVLLYGPKNSGKTLLAKALASEAGARCYMLSMKRLLAQPFLTSGPKLVRQAFKVGLGRPGPFWPVV